MRHRLMSFGLNCLLRELLLAASGLTIALPSVAEAPIEASTTRGAQAPKTPPKCGCKHIEKVQTEIDDQVWILNEYTTRAAEFTKDIVDVKKVRNHYPPARIATHLNQLSDWKIELEKRFKTARGYKDSVHVRRHPNDPTKTNPDDLKKLKSSVPCIEIYEALKTHEDLHDQVIEAAGDNFSRWTVEDIMKMEIEHYGADIAALRALKEELDKKCKRKVEHDLGSVKAYGLICDPANLFEVETRGPGHEGRAYFFPTDEKHGHYIQIVMDRNESATGGTYEFSSDYAAISTRLRYTTVALGGHRFDDVPAFEFDVTKAELECQSSTTSGGAQDDRRAGEQARAGIQRFMVVISEARDRLEAEFRSVRNPPPPYVREYHLRQDVWRELEHWLNELNLTIPALEPSS
jgi:hypothetical protein